MKFDLKIYSEDKKKKRHYHKKETSYSWEKRQIFFAKKKLKAIIILLSLILIYYFASNITGFKDLKAIFKFPLAIAWLIKNFIPDNESLKHIPIIIKTVGETCVIAASATTAAAFFALILALLGSQTTGINKPFKVILTMTASFLRNIPLVAWAMLLLFSFKQNNFTGFLALFIITLGHLVRAFKEMIEETSEESFTALRAAGVPYFPALFNAVFPSIAPGLVSWLLYTVETNVRDSALIGILTGTGIGFLFNLYFKSFRYNSAGLIILCLVIIVLFIDILSNKIRRILL